MKRIVALLVAIAMSMSLVVGCGQSSDQKTTTQVETKKAEHSKMTTDLQALINKDESLKKLVVKSIKKANKINPDKDTNPVQSLDELYEFTDWAATCEPWNVIKGKKTDGLYEHIDQSVDYFWFLVDQPLKELEGKGYYYPTLQYHEPIKSWCKEYADTWGDFLSTKESWNDEYYELAKSDKRFGMDKGWYSDKNIWTSYNDFFSRKLVDQNKSRPIGEEEVVAPADSTPQGVWKIDDKGKLEEKGVIVKSAKFDKISDLIGPESKYKDSFKSGTFTHTFLDVNDYHRYHFPVSGEIVELSKIKGTNAAGGITVWDEVNKKYVLEDQVPGWQMIETRDLVVIKTEDFGYVAILPIGMSQICSCNWEKNLKVGSKVKKGDPMGYFLFGGSDICMIFQKGAKVDYLPKADKDGKYPHIFMGENYADVK